jgi:hypothetical protein
VTAVLVGCAGFAAGVAARLGLSGIYWMRRRTVKWTRSAVKWARGGGDHTLAT